MQTCNGIKTERLGINCEKNILITGITGFVGSHLADFIIKNKKQCKIYGIKRWHLSSMKNLKHIFNKIHFLIVI